MDEGSTEPGENDGAMQEVLSYQFKDPKLVLALVLVLP